LSATIAPTLGLKSELRVLLKVRTRQTKLTFILLARTSLRKVLIVLNFLLSGQRQSKCDLIWGQYRFRVALSHWPKILQTLRVLYS